MIPLKNLYESGEQKMIPAVLLYAFHEDKVLMIHRNLMANDFHEGKWNGLGGKHEAGESALECAIREFKEESGCSTSNDQWKWTGYLHFPNFKPHKNEDWSVTVFRCELKKEQLAEVIEKNKEGTLQWIPSSEVLKLSLWPGDRHFIPHVLNKTAFNGTFYYLNGELNRFICNPIFG